MFLCTSFRYSLLPLQTFFFRLWFYSTAQLFSEMSKTSICSIRYGTTLYQISNPIQYTVCFPCPIMHSISALTSSVFLTHIPVCINCIYLVLFLCLFMNFTHTCLHLDYHISLLIFFRNYTLQSIQLTIQIFVNLLKVLGFSASIYKCSFLFSDFTHGNIKSKEYHGILGVVPTIQIQ